MARASAGAGVHVPPCAMKWPPALSGTMNRSGRFCDVGPTRQAQVYPVAGVVPVAKQAGARVVIDGLRVSFSAFTLHLDRAQRWPNGIAVLTPQAVPPALLALHAALRDGLEGLNVATETRHWRPHPTLARHAGDSAAPAQTSPVHWQVRSYALVESNAVTSDYVVLRRYG
jgi:hypothetical protein